MGAVFQMGGFILKLGGGEGGAPWGGISFDGGGGVLKNIADRMGAPSCPPTMGNPAFLHGG